MRDSIMWQTYNQLAIVAFHLERANAKNPRKVKPPKLKQYPWSPDAEVQKYGNVAPGDERAAVDFLMSLIAD